MKSPFTITYNPDWRRSTNSGQSESPLPPALGDDTAHPAKESVVPLQETVVISPTADTEAAGVEEPNRPATPTAPVRKRSKMNVTWDDERKLRKKSYPQGFSKGAPPTPDPTPERSKNSWFSRFGSKTSPSYPSSTAVEAPPSPPPSPPVWKHHDSYFPEYTPIYPTTTFADPFAKPYPLTPAEVQAQQHAARVGHAVAVHYPMLPPFNEYQKNQGGWQSGQWGNSNWTGFGLNGERLPDGEGKTFGAPMPKGVPIEGPKAPGGAGGAAKKGKGAGGGGGGEEAAAEGGEEAQAVGEDAVPAEGEAAAPAGAGEGGGGGGKKKKKK